MPLGEGSQKMQITERKVFPPDVRRRATDAKKIERQEEAV